MNKLYSILIFLFSFSHLLAFEEIDPSTYSLLLGTVRKEIVSKAFRNIPSKNNISLLQMLNTIKKTKDSFSLSDAESAYLVYIWVTEYIKVDFLDNNKYVENVYNSGKGNPVGVSNLFNLMCNYIKIESKSISGYIKKRNVDNFENYISSIESTWNYIVINNKYYLIDVTLGSGVFNEKYLYSYYQDIYFATKPEIFINSHFPNDKKWQLLSNPYSYEKYKSLPFISDFFYICGFKTFSPDNMEINGRGEIKITLTYGELVNCKFISTFFVNPYLRDDIGVNNKINNSNGKFEIILNKNNKDALLFIIQCLPPYRAWDQDFSIITYKLNPTNN